jgi:hypothetical protein
MEAQQSRKHINENIKLLHLIAMAIPSFRHCEECEARRGNPQNH